MNRKIPKEVFVGMYLPGRKLFEFSVKLKNEPKSLEKVCSLLETLDVKLLNGFFTTHPDGITFAFTSDLTDLELKAGELAKKLKSLGSVLEVRFKGSKPKGFLADELHFPLLALGDRSILLRTDTMREMFKRLYEVFGEGASTIIYYMGMEAGQRKVAKIMKLGLGGKELVELILKERVAKGWCIPKLLEFDESAHKARVRAYQLFECMPRRKGGIGSRFFMGYLSGLFRSIFGDVEVEEVKCISKGDRYCEFVVRPKG